MTEDDLEIVRLREQIYSLQNRISAMSAEMRLLKSENKNLAHSNIDYATSLSKAVEIIEILRNDKAGLEEDIAMLEDELGSHQVSPYSSLAGN